MKKKEFYFNLPPELIAQYPLDQRAHSRMLVYRRADKSHEHGFFKNLTQYLNPGDLLVMNDSKVIPARLYGRKSTGGQVEILIERILEVTHCMAHIKNSKSLREGSLIYINDHIFLKVLEKNNALVHCVANMPIMDILKEQGSIPLPPYMERSCEAVDVERYQTIYAQEPGSVAAPTAGLHFDTQTLSQLADKGVKTAYVTLHVGAGTFQPVKTDSIYDHQMHFERFDVNQEVCDAVIQAKNTNNRVIAVGTTALRSLESAATLNGGVLAPISGETNLFIYPGYQFQICDGLLTNFHLPESTLLMLVSAFIGQSQALALYQEAILQRYRFFSYGDTSLLL